MNTTNEIIYYSNGRGISVTNKFLHTRYKDEALAPVQSVQIGREPLLIAGVVGVGLALFANRFGDLLFWHEQAMLVLAGLLMVAGGYSIASLRLGQYMQEKTVLWSTIWTVNAVRKAIAKAKHSHGEQPGGGIVLNHDDI